MAGNWEPGAGRPRRRRRGGPAGPRRRGMRGSEGAACRGARLPPGGAQAGVEQPAAGGARRWDPRWGPDTGQGAQTPGPGVTLPVQQPWFFGEHPRGHSLGAGVPSAALPVLFRLQGCEALARCEAHMCGMRSAEAMGSASTAAGLKMPSPVALPTLAGDAG